jgi:hypothetical protein
VTWTSSNTAVATINSSTGVATGVSAGTATFTATSTQDTTKSGTSATVTVTLPANVAALNVNLGPNGNYPNGIYTTVTVCEPSSPTTCATIPDVLVDTGSVGLRVLSANAYNTTTQVGSLSLAWPTDTISNVKYNLYDCAEYGDGSYTYGPVVLANVQIGGETATQVPTSAGGTAGTGIPINVILAGGSAPTGAQCTKGGGPSDNSYEVLGANGILGVGHNPQDCSIGNVNYCTSSTTEITPYPYIGCPTSGSCIYLEVPLYYQVWNPVAAFPVDNTGVMFSLPSIPAAGQATATGTLTFGINTESNNQITTQTVYELDAYGNFASSIFNGVTYNSTNSGGTFLDSGSNFLYISDAGTLTSWLGTTVSLCGGSTYTDFYCPSSALSVPLKVTGSNSTSSTVTLSLENASTLLGASPSFAAWDDLGIATCTASCTTSTDYWDLGLPFFYGLPIFVGISGGTTYPLGYWAF